MPNEAEIRRALDPIADGVKTHVSSAVGGIVFDFNLKNQLPQTQGNVSRSPVKSSLRFVEDNRAKTGNVRYKSLFVGAEADEVAQFLEQAALDAGVPGSRLWTMVRETGGSRQDQQDLYENDTWTGNDGGTVYVRIQKDTGVVNPHIGFDEGTADVSELVSAEELTEFIRPITERFERRYLD